uniref:Mitochondrial cardiolipin hydrolase n=2 Tax=Lygus hesperus TaxID=30085 RepID=A0A0A9X842_LYGHE
MMTVNIKDALLVVGGTVGIASLFYVIRETFLKADRDFQKWKAEFHKELGIDRLKLNKNLAFGIQTRSCDVHVAGAVKCKDLECSYGPLSFMLDVIGRAKKSVDVCIYIITAQVFADAIIDARNRGLRVRIIGDSDMSFSAQSSINLFRQLEFPVRQRMSHYIMHHKFILVDDEIVMNGSLNFTMTGALGNWENVIVSSCPEIVQPFLIEFQTLWDEFHPNNPISETEIHRSTRKTKNMTFM